MSQDVFEMKMDLIMERCPGVISIHNDIVVYRVSDEDHDANLINLLNVVQVEGLVLNRKKLELLRAMLKQEAVFAWDKMANASFQKIKDLIAKSATKPLRYYDQRKPMTVQVDATQRGLGTCLLQEGKPIAYASMSLTDTETRYANIERELLAIVFACQWFNTYVLGRPFTVESDHKPLEMIHQKSLASAPTRLQQMLLQLQ